MITLCLYIFGITGGLFYLGNVLWQGISSNWSIINDGDYTWVRQRNSFGYWFTICINLFLSTIFFLMAFGNVRFIELMSENQTTFDIILFALGALVLILVFRDWYRNKTIGKG